MTVADTDSLLSPKGVNYEGMCLVADEKQNHCLAFPYLLLVTG